MKKLIERYDSPTPLSWKRLGDFALVFIPVVQASLGAAPEGVLTVKENFWLGFSLTTVLLLIKFWTGTKTHND